MRKIFFVRASSGPYGGAEKYLSRLAKVIKEKDIEYEILNSSLPGWLPSWIRALLFDLQLCFSKKEKFYFSLDRIGCCDIYRAGDGVHKEFLKTKGLSLNPLHLAYLYLERKAFKNAKKIIANSKMVKRQIVKNYDIPPEKIVVIYNGIEIKDFDKNLAKEKISKEFKVSENKKIILFVGSGFARKGVKEFLEILSFLKSDFHAFVVGKEKKISEYETLAERLRISDKITFTGPRKDADTFYAAADIFLFPTRYEPFSNAVLEAMSFENVVFTTLQNGASEILPKKYLMDSPSDFVSERIDELLQNEDRLRDIQKRMREIAKKFTIEKNALESIEVIDEVLKQKSI